MNRLKKTKGTPLLRRSLAFLLFCGMIILFLTGLSSVSRITSENEEEGLKRSIIQSAVHCYATEGFYPDKLEYLEDHYGIIYDKKKYIVSYETIGSNIMPDVTVFPLTLKKEGENE